MLVTFNLVKARSCIYHIAVAIFLLDLNHLVFFFSDRSPSRLDLLDDKPSLEYHFTFFASWSLVSTPVGSSDVLDDAFLDLLVSTRLSALLTSHEESDFLIGCWETVGNEVVFDAMEAGSSSLIDFCAVFSSDVSFTSSIFIWGMFVDSTAFSWFLKYQTN